ncbi:MAG: response regulator transcription factor [Coriobacteriaceae bacterium]|nr:response regulator transcription factor [Coriobacteriaceae bacterium]
MIRIVLADDHAMVRMGFKMILEQQGDFQVVGEASEPDSAFELVRELKPDVLVTDVSMDSDKNGLLLAERIEGAGLACAVLVLTMHAEQEYLRQAMERGARGYVLKSSSDETLVHAIRAIERGDSFICEEMLGDFIRDSLSGNDPAASALTPRESELVSLSVRGYSNSAIADMLGIDRVVKVGVSA